MGWQLGARQVPPDSLRFELNGSSAKRILFTEERQPLLDYRLEIDHCSVNDCEGEEVEASQLL